MSLSRTDVQRYEGLIAGLRVNELQTLLVVFNLPKLGKKQELIQRAYSLLHSATSQGRLVTTLEDITRRSAPSRSAPYPQQLVQLVLIPNLLKAISDEHDYIDFMTRRNGYVPNMNPAISQIRPPPMQAHRTVKGLRTVVLPFYDLISTLIEPIELPAMVGAVKTSKQIITFGLSPTDIVEFKDKPLEKELPRYELQLRFFNVSGEYAAVEQPDDFPLNCFVRLDDQIVVLPNVIPTNKPNAEPKRPSRPVNITPYCCPPRPVHMPHSLSVEWSADRRAWACGLYKVRRVTSKILYDRANSNHAVRLTSDITRQIIIRRLSGDDDGICLSQIKVSLLCPLGKIRMVLPARGRECTHLQCFDLKLFLEMNEKRPTWKCAVCSGPCHYNNLIIDGYFEDILNSVANNVTEVELLRDGGYQTIHEEDASSSDDNADEIVPVDGPSTSTVTNTKPLLTNNYHQQPQQPQQQQQQQQQQPFIAPKSKPEDDIITLSDSDDDDDLAVQRAVENSVATSRGNHVEPQYPQPTCPSSPCSSDNSVIILDDTPPRPVPAARLPLPLIPPTLPLKTTGPSTPNSVSKIPLPPPIKISVGRQNMPPTSIPPPLIPQVSSQLPQGNQPSRLNMSYEGSGYRLPPVSNANYFGIAVSNPLTRLGNGWQNNPPLQPGMGYQNTLIGRQQQFNAQPYGYRPQANSISPVTNLQDRYDGGHMNLAQALQNLQNDTGYTSEFRK
ncbi:unnamed protein product [Auanema sp. JU1783]|nr:unnamed protein product [Auanema sp. JU1783]